MTYNLLDLDRSAAKGEKIEDTKNVVAFDSRISSESNELMLLTIVRRVIALFVWQPTRSVFIKLKVGRPPTAAGAVARAGNG